MATEDNEDYRAAEPHVEAAESSEVPKHDVEAYRQASQMEDTLLQNRLWAGGRQSKLG